MNRKFLSSLLGLGIVGAVCSQRVFAADTTVYIQNYLYPSTTYTVVSPVNYTYYIRNASELNWVAYMVTQGYNFQGCTIEIVNDLDFKNVEFIPIGTYYTCFQGMINGNGHWIHNLTLNYPGYYGIGIIGYLGIYGIVKDLNVGSSCKFTGYGNVGGIVGCNAGLVTHCSSAAQLFAVGDFVGGIAGYNDFRGRVQNCEVRSSSSRNSGSGIKIGLFIGDNYGNGAESCRTYMFYPW